MRSVFLIFLSLFSLAFYAQTGVVKGKIIDKQSEKPISGAVISLAGNEDHQTVSDVQGNFKLSDIPLGRQSLNISFNGYENTSVSDIDVTTGKDNLLTISMVEKFNTLDEVVVTSGSNKVKPVNKMAMVSAKQFADDGSCR